MLYQEGGNRRASQDLVSGRGVLSFAGLGRWLGRWSTAGSAAGPLTTGFPKRVTRLRAHAAAASTCSNGSWQPQQLLRLRAKRSRSACHVRKVVQERLPC